MSVVKHMRPANQVIRISPEKEERSQSNIDKKKNNDGPTMCTSINSINNNNKDESKLCDLLPILDYTAVEDKNHPDFGQNGLLDPERYKSGDHMPLLTTDHLPECNDVPKDLMLCSLDGCGTIDENFISEQIKHNQDNYALRGIDSERDSRFLEINGNSKFNNETPEIRNRHPYIFDQYEQPHDKNTIKDGKQLPYMTFTNNAGTNTTNLSSTHNNSNSNLARLTGNNTCYPIRYYQPQQNTISPINRHNQKQQSEHEQRLERRNYRRKPHSKDKGQIIKPQEQPGYVGDMDDVDDIMKKLGFEHDKNQQRNQKMNNGSATALNNSGTKKQAKKQKQKQRQQPTQPFLNDKVGEILAKVDGIGARQISSEEEKQKDEIEEAEEMDVDIDLDKDDQDQEDDRQEETAVDEEPDQRTTKPKLIELIPQNVLSELGWKCPFTIVNPFIDSKKMGEAERRALWESPADRWLETKPEEQPQQQQRRTRGIHGPNS